MEVETEKTEQQETEAEISRAMRARVKDFKDQADSLTLEGVRRALEKDLGMETFSLDVHKRFIKQCLEECFYGGDDSNLSATTESASDQRSPHLNKEAFGASDDQQLEDPKSSSSDINETKKESPAEELTRDDKPMKTGDLEHDDKLNEDIKKAIKKQSPYLRANLENMTLAKVRRLLEQDLNLEKNTLDAYKSFISGVLDEILRPSEFSEPVNGIKKKPKKSSQNKETGKVKKETKTATTKDSGSSKDNDMSEADEDSDVVKRPKKRPLQKEKSSMKPLKHLKTSLDENIPSGSTRKKHEVLDKEGSESDDGKPSEDDRAPSSSDERSKKKHEKSTAQVYGKHVERLKSVIKACGMGVPPSVYKRAKQAPDSKREAFLIKELEDILAKEGLSSNPSDKEIKAVKKLKERARELEGIDTSNIVSSSRRRSTFSFIPTPKPKAEAGSDEDEEDEVQEDEDDQEGTDDGDNGSGESSEGSEEDADVDADEESD